MLNGMPVLTNNRPEVNPEPSNVLSVCCTFSVKSATVQDVTSRRQTASCGLTSGLADQLTAV